MSMSMHSPSPRPGPRPSSSPSPSYSPSPSPIPSPSPSPSPRPSPRPSPARHLLLQSLVYYDLETTGLGKTAEIRICEIGMVRQKEQFQRYVKPTISISPSASKVHGLKKEFLSKYPPWRQIGREMNEFIEETEHDIILAGFNSKRYDSRILFFEHHRHGLEFPPHVHFIDFREILPYFFKLSGKKTLNAYHEYVTGETISNAHTAIGDCLALKTIIDTITDKTSLADLILKQKETVSGLTKRCIK